MNNGNVLLSEELKFYLKNWKINSEATEAQKAKWSQDRKLPIIFFGRNHPNTLRLLTEDGWDGKSVSKRPTATVRQYFYDNAAIWPPDRDVIRFGCFVHLDFFRILVLVLKSQWERHFAKKMHWLNDLEGRNLNDILKKDHSSAREHNASFTPGLHKTMNSKELFDCFEEHKNLATKAGYNLEQFSLLIQHMILSHIHMVGTCSPEMEIFIKAQKDEVVKRQSVSKEVQEEHWVQKGIWITIENEMENELLKCENLRLKNAKIKHKWLARYGKIYFELFKTEIACTSLKQLIELKNADKKLNREDCEQLAREKRREEQKKLEDMKADIHFAERFENSGESKGCGQGATETVNYDKECKKICRKIYMLTHPDKLTERDFTRNQLNKLGEYYRQAMNIDRDEVVYDRRSLYQLLDILGLVKSIWEIMGVDTDEAFIIKGDSLEEQIRWFKNRIQYIETQLSDIKAIMFMLINDVDIREKEASLASESIIEQTKSEMEKKLAEKKQELDSLGKEVDMLFN
ncbi:MAG: hypothetical protein C4531_17565 [Desulfurivibrio sp.]|nr:MAG: hypothetical protein C4531_17565 [Desulfurivibrio sp.]